MSYAQNSTVLESTTSYDTIWSDSDWKKTYKYVNKQRFRIFRAESEDFQINVYLSRMSWKRHVRFSRGCGWVIIQSYLTPPSFNAIHPRPWRGHGILASLDKKRFVKNSKSKNSLWTAAHKPCEFFRPFAITVWNWEMIFHSTVYSED